MKKLILKILINLLNLSSKTWRFRVQGKLLSSPSIIVFWHSYLLAGWKYISTNGNYYAVVSPSRDGQYLVDLLTKWKLSFIRGSSDKNSKELLHNIVDKAKINSISLTPDGPKGPKNKLKAGAVVAAHRAQVPIQFLKIKIKQKFVFSKSWDKFELPYPFALIHIVVSEPILVPIDASREEIDKLINFIEKEMNNV